MKIQIVLLPLLVAVATIPVTIPDASAAKSADAPRVKAKTQTQSSSKPSDTILIRPNRKVEKSVTRQHSMNTFTDMSQSIPSEAVKDDLAHKHALPGQQSAVLTPGDPATANVSSPTLNSAATGAAPSMQSGSGMAIPQPTSSSFGTFK